MLAHDLAQLLLAQPNTPVVVAIDATTLDEYAEAVLDDGTQFLVESLDPSSGLTTSPAVIVVTLMAEDDEPDDRTPAEAWWDEHENEVMEGIAVGDLDSRGRPQED